MLIDILTDDLGLSTRAAQWVAKALLFVAILVGVWVVRRLIDVVLPRLLAPIAQRTATRVDDRFVVALGPPLRFVITLGGLALAILALELPESVNRLVIAVLNSLVVFAVFWTIFRLVNPVGDLVARVYQRTAQAAAMPDVLTAKLSQVGKQIAKGLIVVLAFAAILDAWGMDVNGLIAGFGIAGAAVALATKDTLANLLGYFVILADEPLNEGEYIVLDSVAGTVEHIGFRSTRVRALDQSLIFVPNNTIMNANVTNWSRLTKRRLNMTLGVEYGSSPDQVLSVVQAIRDMLNEHESVEPDSVVVQFTNFSESTLEIIIICFLSLPAWADFQAARQDINLRIMHLLAERGVDIAFPTRRVLFETVAADGGPAAEPDPPLPPLKPEPLPGASPASSVPPDADNAAAQRSP